MADAVTAAQALNNIKGIITNEGLSHSIAAQQHEGWKIYPRAFAISEQLSLFDNSRTSDSMNPTWYEGPISGVVQQSVNTLEFLCTIPPGVTPDNKYFREIYVTALTNNDQLFLLGLGQIEGDVIYNPGGATKLRILISIQNVNIANLFEFKYTQATEIEDHNHDPMAHPDIRQILTGLSGSTIINNNYFSQPGDTVFVDSRNNPVAVTLPIQDLNLGTRVTVIDIGLAGATPGRDITIRRNGNKIDNRQEDFRIDTSGGMVDFIWHPALQSWRINIGGRFFRPHPDLSPSIGILKLSDYLDPNLMFASGGLTPDYALDGGTVTARAGSLVFVDTSSGPVTVRLPLSPVSGNRIQIADIKGTAKANNIIVSGQGNRIAGSSANYRIVANFAIYTFIWEDANKNWLIDMGGMQASVTVVSSTIKVTSTIAANANFVVPSYIVGSGTLRIWFNGARCYPGTDKTIHQYVEVGAVDANSTIVQFNEILSPGDVVFVEISK